MGKGVYRAGRGAAAAAVLAGLAGLGVAAPAGAVWAAPGTVRAAGSWGKAIGVPGLGALNKGGLAEVKAVSCVSPGYCAAGGTTATATVARGSWLSSGTAAGARRSGCLAWAH